MAEQNSVLLGCDYDSVTAKALAGKDIVALVTDKYGEKLLAVAGQQGLSYEASGETTESTTKDDSAGGWSIKFHAGKSWTASIDGLYSPDDEATKMIAWALENDEYLCLKICKRTKNEDGDTVYTPLRMGLAIVSSDSFEAPNDDSATYSMDFEGTGKPWMYETADPDEIEAATWTVKSDDGDEEPEG